jgi:hypothetical protein
MDAPYFLAAAGVLVGAWTGFSLVSRKRGALRIAGHLGVYLLASILAGLTAAFLATSKRDSSPAYALGRGISETMNCAAYGLIAGVLVAGLTIAWRRRASSRMR